MSSWSFVLADLCDLISIREEFANKFKDRCHAYAFSGVQNEVLRIHTTDSQLLELQWRVNFALCPEALKVEAIYLKKVTKSDTSLKFFKMTSDREPTFQLTLPLNTLISATEYILSKEVFDEINLVLSMGMRDIDIEAYLTHTCVAELESRHANLTQLTAKAM